MSTRICAHCGKSFTASRGPVKWCTDCKTVLCTCVVCGTQKSVPRADFELSLRQNPNYEFTCSLKCKGEKISGRPAWVVIPCPQCGKLNKRKTCRPGKGYCNSRCFGDHKKENPDQYPKPTFSAQERKRRSIAHRGKGNPMYSMSGPKSPRWKGGRTKYRGVGWNTIRRLIRRRDLAKCAICGKSLENAENLDVHHIVNWADVQCNHPYNLISVCRQCHRFHIHGNSPAPSSQELVALAKTATVLNLAEDDFECILQLDIKQRKGRGLPLYAVKLLTLPETYLTTSQ